MAGRGDEDIEAGHSLMSDSLARSIQREFIVFAGRDEAALGAVLRSSASARDRALAAQVVAYAPDKRAVVPALVEALSDPDATVRNNAVRALALTRAWARDGRSSRSGFRGSRSSRCFDRRTGATATRYRSPCSASRRPGTPPCSPISGRTRCPSSGKRRSGSRAGTRFLRSS